MHEATHNIDQASHLRTMALNCRPFDGTAQPHVWTVTSGKGGVGKSVIALNLAIVMSEQGRKVLLVDADENLGKLDVLCNVSPFYRMSDIVTGKADIHGTLVTIAENVSLLAGNSGSIHAAEISHDDRQYLIERIIRSGNGITDIIFDTGAGVSNAVLQYATAADQAIIVSHHEPTAVMDAYATIKLICSYRPSAAPTAVFRLIMNSSISPTESDDAAEKLQTAVGHFLRTRVDYLGSIPTDEHVSRSVREQKPLMVLFPNSAFGLSLRAIGLRLGQTRSVFHQLNEMVLA